MDNEILVKEEVDIKNMIYTIRGKQVMLDSDIANLFGYSTKDLNRNVRNNIERFPENFCFQLNNIEYESLRCKIFTLKGRGQHRKYLPYVFTEYGITMLAGLLKSNIAINISIKIINEFVEMRKFLLSNGQVFERLTNVEYKLLEHDKKFDEVFNCFQKEESIKERIFFEGQIYDAYSLIIDLIKKASRSILIIDNKELYHIGASLKDLGNKCFGINKIEDKEILEKLISDI